MANGQIKLDTARDSKKQQAKIAKDRVSTGVLNFRASLYRDQFQFFGPYWYINF